MLPISRDGVVDDTSIYSPERDSSPAPLASNQAKQVGCGKRREAANRGRTTAHSIRTTPAHRTCVIALKPGALLHPSSFALRMEKSKPLTSGSMVALITTGGDPGLPPGSHTPQPITEHRGCPNSHQYRGTWHTSGPSKARRSRDQLTRSQGVRRARTLLQVRPACRAEACRHPDRGRLPRPPRRVATRVPVLDG